MGSSSSSTAAAAAAASGSSSSNQNPYAPHHHHHHQYYPVRSGNNEYSGGSNRYFDEYCYGGGGSAAGQYGGQQQQQQTVQQNPGMMQNSGSNRDLYHTPSSSHAPPIQSSAPSCSSKQEKKKKWWKRRSSRSTDPGQPLRELLANWSLGEIVALVHEYETMTNEKELYIHAESSRPRAPTLRSDLADLLDFKWNSDVNLVLPPAIFPAHRAILSQRSKYFRNLLNNSSNSSNSVTNNGIVNVNVEDTSGVDIPTFSGLLRYLYTEEVPSGQRSSSEHSGEGNGGGQSSSYHGHLGTMIRPSKALESDLRDLLQTGKYSDIVLVLGDEQFAVHKPILAARSPFFRSLLQRRSNSKKIVLDDTVIPKRYARVILNCMYTDKLDLSLIEPSRSGLSEVESLTFTGKVNPSGFEEAMELYQIGRFLEFDHLCVSSEDIIVESLTHDSLPQILRWSSQSHGSSWVRRQALMYVQEEYASLISNPSFLELDKHTLLEVVQSDFLQASEVEVLNSIVKWGEHQLLKRVEDREPNLVKDCQATGSYIKRDSVFRNGGAVGAGGGDRGKERRKGRNDKISYSSDIHLNDGELREIVFELIRCVRTDHIGLSNEFLLAAVRRGLVSIPPTHMITEEKVNPWVNNLQCPNYIRPRLYTPYYEEAKSALRSRTGGGGANSNSTECLGYVPSSSSNQQQQQNLAYLNSIGRIKTLRPIIPDTLYMIDDGNGVVSYHAGGKSSGGGHHHHHHHHHHHRHQVEDCGMGGGEGKESREDGRKDEDKPGAGGDGVVGGAEEGVRSGVVDELVIDQEVLNAMLYREKKLRSAHLRNLNNPISRERASRYIRLRVVREFGYPDYVAELLDHHNRASLNSSTTAHTSTTTTSTTQTASNASPTKKEKQQQATKTAEPATTNHSPLYQPPPPLEFHNSNMPDVAINTNVEHEPAPASSAVESSVVVPLLDLDLGDNGVANSATSGLVRSRNRSFGSLNSGGRGSTLGLVSSLGGRVGSSSSVLGQPTYGGSLSAVGTLHLHHHYGTVQTTQQSYHTHYATPSSSTTSSIVRQQQQQQPVYQQPYLHHQQPHQSIYSTANRHHHHYQQPTYSTCSNSTLLQQQQQQQHQHLAATSSSSSLLRSSASSQQQQDALLPPSQSTLLRSATLQMKSNQQSTHHHHHHHGNTPPSHYL